MGGGEHTKIDKKWGSNVQTDEKGEKASRPKHLGKNKERAVGLIKIKTDPDKQGNVAPNCFVGTGKRGGNGNRLPYKS